MDTHEVKAEMQERRHQSIPDQGRGLAAVLRGHYAYYGVPTNYYVLNTFRSSVARHWCCSPRQQSQHRCLDWNRMRWLVTRWLPSATIVHPWPNQRFRVTAQGKSPVR
jgi:RNA-directed DNA polymerase